jgi:asparagine synthase (glutamine-hydrolysing)
MLEIYDQPFADSSGIPTLAVSELASTQVKVVLSGDGGDEIFAGYNWHRSYLELPRADHAKQLLYNKLLMPVMGALSPLPKVTGLISHYQIDTRGKTGVERYGALRSHVKSFQKSRLLPDLRHEFHDYDDYWHFRKFWREDLDPVSRLQHVDLRTYLPDNILTKVDRASMAVSLEVRPPLLDHELIEMVISLPPEYRYRKRILRAAAANMLPDEILTREKKGFSAPLLNWLTPTTRNGARLGGMALWGVLLLDEWKR